jgi:hypothetical protein
MPGCSIEREIVGSTAQYRVTGKFEGACAWELAGRIEKEPLGELALDFSQCGEFVDYGIAVLANALLGAHGKVVHLKGLRQHQLRLFKYFGVDPDQLLHPEVSATTAPGTQPLAKEVA